MGLVRGTVCHYSLGRCSSLVVCAQRSRQVRGVGDGAGPHVPPLLPPVSRAHRGACGGLCRLGVASPRLPVRLSMRSVRSAGSVRSPFRSATPALCVCVRLRSRGVRALRPMRGSGVGRP